MTAARITVTVADRPYLISFGHSWGDTYPIGAEEVRRLVAAYPVLIRKLNRLTLRADDGRPVVIHPATLGGGDCFTA